MKLKIAFKYLKKPIIIFLVTIIGLLMLPNKNLISITLYIILVALINDFTNYKRPNIKRWIRITSKTITYLVIIYLILTLLGGWGIISLIMIVLLLAAWRIKTNWTLYKYTVNWMGDRIWRGSKEDFNLEKLREQK
jgi:hypothetical protein